MNNTLESFNKEMYLISSKDYIPFHTLQRNNLKPNEIIKLDIGKILLNYLKTNNVSDDFLYPLPKQSEQSLFFSSTANEMFLNFPSLRDTVQIFEINFGESRYMRGFILKILINYSINRIEFLNLIHGGLFYYTYLKDGKYLPSNYVIDGFLKSDYSFFKDDSDNFKPFFLRQEFITNSEFDVSKISQYSVFATPLNDKSLGRNLRIIYFLRTN
jgi:hypothetical protein